MACDELMTRNTSVVAFCCSTASFSSRLSPRPPFPGQPETDYNRVTSLASGAAFARLSCGVAF